MFVFVSSMYILVCSGQTLGRVRSFFPYVYQMHVWDKDFQDIILGFLAHLFLSR